MNSTIRILVADDHPIVREGLIAILSTQADFHIVGEAATGIDTLRQVAALHPDILVLDLEMAEMDGVEVIRRLKETQPDAHVIVFTAFDTDERILGAIRAGARGYLLKGAPREEIFQAVRVVHAGNSLLQPVIASKLLRQMRHDSPTILGVEQLTRRELDVLRLLAQGLENKEIASSLVITERTVKFHVSSILSKLGAGNRTEAVKIAVQHGLIRL